MDSACSDSKWWIRRHKITLISSYLCSFKAPKAELYLFPCKIFEMAPQLDTFLPEHHKLFLLSAPNTICSI